MTSTRNVGQAFTWGAMGAEALQTMQDLRWMIVTCAFLIFLDYHFGSAESRKRHKEALDEGNLTLAKMYEFHWSRAVRRTFNKSVDYLTWLLAFTLIGVTICEPWGICSHVITASFAVLLACAVEIVSAFGHFFYLRGINIRIPKVSWKSAFVFIGRFLAGFARTKDEDLGNALDDTITQTLNEEKHEDN